MPRSGAVWPGRGGCWNSYSSAHDRATNPGREKTNAQLLAHPNSGASWEDYAIELVLDAVRANALGGGARLRLGPSPPTEQRKTKVFLRNLLSFGRVPDGRSDTLLERSRPPLPHRLEAVPIQGNCSTASWANDLALRFQLTKPFGERVVAARARHRDLRITQ